LQDFPSIADRNAHILACKVKFAFCPPEGKWRKMSFLELLENREAHAMAAPAKARKSAKARIDELLELLRDHAPIEEGHERVFVWGEGIVVQEKEGNRKERKSKAKGKSKAKWYDLFSIIKLTRRADVLV
jgi:hypothetical protein